MAPDGASAADVPTCFYCGSEILACIRVPVTSLTDAHGNLCCPDCRAASRLFDAVRSVTL